MVWHNIFVPKYRHHSRDPECAMARRRAGRSHHHCIGLRADKGSAIAAFKAKKQNNIPAILNKFCTNIQIYCFVLE